MIKDFCCALVYLHSQVPQFVHGDIKDTNAFVETTWNGGLNIKLLDFGLGRVLTRMAKPLGGTLVWEAPELLQSTVVGPHSSADIFSFGRLLCKIMTETRGDHYCRPMSSRTLDALAGCSVGGWR